MREGGILHQYIDNEISRGEGGKVSRKNIKAFLKVMLSKPNTEIELRGHYLEVRLIGKEGEPQRFFLPAEDPDLEARLSEIVEQAVENRRNVYVGLALRDNDKRGKDVDCSMVTLLVVDHDEIDGVKIKDNGAVFYEVYV
jgi:acetyl/propionyl-CoA carboxylase alpha subunit